MYGAIGQGMCPTRRRQVRTMAVKCLCPGGFRACPVTAISLHLPRALNPCVSAPVATVQAWMLIWTGASQDDKQEIRSAWRVKRDELTAMPSSSRWQAVSGPMAATIVTLLEISWHPAQPHLWITNRPGEIAALTGEMWEMSSITAAVQEAFQQQQWQDASKHFAGDGLQFGTPSFAAARRAKKNCCVLGCIFRLAVWILRCVVDLWPASAAARQRTGNNFNVNFVAK